MRLDPPFAMPGPPGGSSASTAGPSRRTLLLALTASAGAGLTGVAAARPAHADVAHSPNGWPVSPDPAAIGVAKQTVPGTGVRLAVVGGPGGVVLLEVARRFAAEVERLNAGACWGYAFRVNANNPGVWSNHASGTAVDLNATLHPNGAVGTFTSGQTSRIHALVADMDLVVRWGGDYSHTVDPMHFELNVPPGSARLQRLATAILKSRG